MNRPIPHADYIRLKYLEGGLDHQASNDKKKRKQKKSSKQSAPNFKIIDDDIDLNNITVKDEDEDDMKFATQEEKPFIADIIDERPNHLKRLDEDRGSWLTLDPLDEGIKEEPKTPSNRESPSRRTRSRRHDSDSDASPPRRRTRQDSDSDLSVERPHRRHDSDSDISPPRTSEHNSNRTHEVRRKRHDSDQSPPRRTRHDSDSSPARRPQDRQKERHSRRLERRRDSSDNEELLGKLSFRETSHSSRHHRIDQKEDTRQTLGGKVAGLSDSKSVRRELEELKSREKRLLNRTDDEALGRHAKTVYRDRGTGKIRDMEAEASVQIKPDKDEEERQAKYKEWSRGLKQRQEQKSRAQEDMKEMEKPLARYQDDQDRDKYLKDRELQEDPMLQFIRKRKEKEEVKAASSRGEVLLVKPKYSGPAAPVNRFGILPGYRWDGVDRSNGFEKKLMEKSNETLARQEEAYRWGTEDM